MIFRAIGASIVISLDIVQHVLVKREYHQVPVECRCANAMWATWILTVLPTKWSLREVSDVLQSADCGLGGARFEMFGTVVVLRLISFSEHL